MIDHDHREIMAALRESAVSDSPTHELMKQAADAIEDLLSRAAEREPLHESPAIQAARDVLDGLEPWEIHNRAREEMRSALDDIPCCESATAMVHAEDHGAPEPEWEYGTAHADDPQSVDMGYSLAGAQRRVALWNASDPDRKGIVVRAPKRCWEPLPAGGESDAEA